MMKIKKYKLIILILLVILVYSGLQNPYIRASIIIRQFIPLNAELLEYNIRESNFHGDGQDDFYFKVSKEDISNFIQSNRDWKEYKLDLKLRVDVPIEFKYVKNAKYIFHDQSPDTEYEANYNFAIIDLDEGLLYVKTIDT
ncbi:MAG: hypothetical protein ACD_28C00232G0002 [uncultured bacterium]|nr:MAG: hypothetical protein ACD_28C00232G0002 [uncultured bacterium]KKT74706.1 MAG: hypothetical protein UW70_C0047G0007 [Candidatus Peregrinibacteria bacterium GW2011_GWA2_44_7]